MIVIHDDPTEVQFDNGFEIGQKAATSLFDIGSDTVDSCAALSSCMTTCVMELYKRGYDSNYIYGDIAQHLQFAKEDMRSAEIRAQNGIGDPVPAHWKKPCKKRNVINLNPKPNDILEDALDELTNCVIVGYDRDGDFYAAHASEGITMRKDALWLLEQARIWILDINQHNC